MSSPVTIDGRLAPDAPDLLATLVRNFDRNSGQHSVSIREMARQNRESFFADATKILAAEEDSRGTQFLLATLAENGMLARALSDPVLTLGQAIILARSAAQSGQMVDVEMAHYLAEHVASVGCGPCTPQIQRLMDILSDISDGSRILPSLMALARQSSPYLQSKAVLMIGRINRNVKWVLSRMREPDPRVRANAIEALWGVDTEEVRQLLRGAARDANNRVAGNALIGLYRLGDTWCIPELLEMAGHGSRRFRVTAAWIMGETGDPRFTKILGRMVAEPNTDVRARALAALGRIKAAVAAARQAGQWRVHADFRQSRKDGWREIHVDLRTAEGRDPVDILPTQFILSEEGQAVVDYTVEKLHPPRVLSVAFIYPRREDSQAAPFSQGVLRTLAWKRPADQWAAVAYRTRAGAEIDVTLLEQNIALPVEESEDDSPVRFTTDAHLFTKDFSNPPARLDCSDLWGAMRRAIYTRPVQSGGLRHLIVYHEREAGQSASYTGLASALLTTNTRVHAVSPVSNPRLDSLCQTSKGTVCTVASPEDAGECVEQTYLRLLARYIVRYHSVAAASELTVRVQSPGGWGEVRIPVPS